MDRPKPQTPPGARKRLQLELSDSALERLRELESGLGAAGLRNHLDVIREALQLYSRQQNPLVVAQAAPVKYASCFISYSSKDADFVERLYADIKTKGVPCWFAPEDLKGGDRFRDVIEKNITVHEKMLLILSQNSIESPWVEREVLTAQEREDRTKTNVLVPINLDNSIVTATSAWAAEIRRARHIIDFTNHGRPDGYARAVNRLLRDIAK